MQDAAYKSCSKCGESKPLDDFPKDKRRRDGRGSDCRSCHGQRVKRWNRANRAANNAYRAEWARADRAENPEKAAAYRQRFFEAKGPTYQSWCAMINRCFQPSQPSYQYYGARGITVCERWRSYENFLADMGERPEGMTLDRIDNDLGYEPSNCRWATATEQSRNQRRHAGKQWPGSGDGVADGVDASR